MNLSLSKSDVSVGEGAMVRGQSLIWPLAAILLVLISGFASTDQAKAADEGQSVGKNDAHGTATGDQESVDLFGKALDLSIWTIVVFLVLLVVLRKYAWKPLLEGLEQREHSI